MIARLFSENTDLEAFRERVVALKGDFPFEKDDMTALGDVYFERFPDSFSNRNCRDVTRGYRMVRICVIEKLVNRCPAESIAPLRDMFYDVATLQPKVELFVRDVGRERALECHRVMEDELAAIRHVIDSLPIGMIKERFISGISHIYNAIYLIKGAIDKFPVG